jgi:hypothetical protein
MRDDPNSKVIKDWIKEYPQYLNYVNYGVSFVANWYFLATLAVFETIVMLMAKDISDKFEQLTSIVEISIPLQMRTRHAWTDNKSIVSLRVEAEEWTVLRIWNVNQKLIGLANRLSSVFGMVSHISWNPLNKRVVVIRR